MLDAARTQIANDHRVLRDQSQAIVERLVAQGFSPAQLAQSRAELAEVRRRMAALRRRLHHLQRRLTSAFASAGKTGDASFAKLLGAQLDRLKKLEPGLARALLALQTVEAAYGGFGDGTPILRVSMSEDVEDAAALSAEMVGLSPGDAVSRTALDLLRGGPSAGPSERAPRANAKHASVQSMGDLARALLSPKLPKKSTR